jgi:hypothetical protein
VVDVFSTYLTPEQLQQITSIDWSTITADELATNAGVQAALSALAKTLPERRGSSWVRSTGRGLRAAEGAAECGPDRGRNAYADALELIVGLTETAGGAALLAASCPAVPALCAAAGILLLLDGFKRSYEVITGRALAELIEASACARDEGVCGDGICFLENDNSCAVDCAEDTACADLSCFTGQYAASGIVGACGSYPSRTHAFSVTIADGVLSIPIDDFFNISVVAPLEPSADRSTASFDGDFGGGAYALGTVRHTSQGVIVEGRSSQYCNADVSRQLPDMRFTAR